MSGAPEAVEVAPGVRRLALPSDTLPPYDATHLWILSAADQAALVDPGFRDPDDLRHVERALRAAGVRDLKMVLLTHTHPDHVAGLPAVLERFGAVPVHVHPAEAGRLPPGTPTRPLGDGRRLMLAGRVVRAVHTPGHAPGHLAFHLPEAEGVVAGDLLTDRGASWVGLPEGDARAYLASLDRIEALAPAWIGTGHGGDPGPPAEALRRARRHRRTRETQVEAALGRPRRLDELRGAVYPDAPEAARRLVDASLLAHLAKLMAEMRVVHLGDGPEGPYRRRG